MNLNQITISSNELAKSIVFYKKLGLHLIVDALPRYARFECPNGNSTFSIHLAEKQAKHNNIVIYFEEELLDDKIYELQQMLQSAQIDSINKRSMNRMLSIRVFWALK